VTNFNVCGTSFFFIDVLGVVILSGAKNLRSFFGVAHQTSSQRCFAPLNMTRTLASFFRVTDGIFYSGFAKAFESQETGIAFAAGEAFG
jgi:hypothetical protein